eukprot:COSAG03_NODE_10901_length_623_cov_0.706107_2_plen_126_part_00
MRLLTHFSHCRVVGIGLNDREYDADLSGAGGTCQTYIGCQGRVGSEGQFVWTDGTASDFFYWTDPQPDNAAEGEEHEDCGELYDGYGGGVERSNLQQRRSGHLSLPHRTSRVPACRECTNEVRSG